MFNSVIIGLGIGVAGALFITILICIVFFLKEEIESEKINNKIKRKKLTKTKKVNKR